MPTPDKPPNWRRTRRFPILINPPKLSRVPAATGFTFDTVLDTNLSLGCPSLHRKSASESAAESIKGQILSNFTNAPLPSLKQRWSCA